MANTGLIVFLPLLSAFVGAIIGAWANSWYRNREAQKARDEEREGLLILLSIEAATNNVVLRPLLEQRGSNPDIDYRARVAADLQNAVWDESKVRLAQLRIPGTYLSTVALYYERIEILRRVWKVLGRYASDTKNARERREDGISIIKDAQRYISDSEFARRLLDEDV